MKKVLSFTLALVLMLSAIIIAPAASAATEDLAPVGAEQELCESGATMDEAAPTGAIEFFDWGKASFYAIITSSDGRYVSSDGSVISTVRYDDEKTHADTVWQFTKVYDGVYTITGALYKQRMEVENNNTYSGARIRLGAAGTASGQMWQIIKYGNPTGAQTYALTPMCATDLALQQDSYYIYNSNLSVRSRSYTSAQLFNIFETDPLYPDITSIKNSVKGQTIAWSAGDGKASSYRVYIKNADKWEKLADVKGTTYLNTAVKSGKIYTYTVRALNAKGKVTGSYNTDGVKKKYYATPAIKLSNTAKGVKVSWDKVTGAKYYRAYRQESGKDWQPLGITENTSWTNTKVESGKKYSYTARVCDKDGNVLSAYKGKSITYIAAPKISKIAFSKAGHVIKWKKSAGAVKYRVFLQSGKNLIKLGDTTKTSFTYKYAKVGVKYTYAVRCISKDAKSYTSALGATKSFKSLKAPTGIKLEKYGSSIQIDWNRRGGTQKYRIYYRYKSSAGTSSWSQWYELGDREQSEYNHYAFYSPYGGRKYQIGVRCITDDGTALSAMSTSSTMRYAQAPVISGSRWRICTAGDYVSFSWNSSPGAYKYRVYMWQNNKWTKMTEQYSNTYYYYTYPSGTFRFAVRAIDSEGHNLSILRTIRMEQHGRNGGTYYTSLEYI